MLGVLLSVAEQVLMQEVAVEMILGMVEAILKVEVEVEAMIVVAKPEVVTMGAENWQGVGIWREEGQYSEQGVEVPAEGLGVAVSQ